MSIKTDLKTVREFMGLFTDYRKSRAIEALNNIQKELKDSEKKYEESMRMLETYIRKLHESEAENKRLREAAKVYISDVSEYCESFCLAAGHDPATCNECKLKELVK